MGLVYPCFCTRAEVTAEVAASAVAPHGADGPIYPGSCRALDPALRERRLAGEAHSWRLDGGRAVALAGPLAWRDEAAGEVAAVPERHGDVVLARKDAPVSYHLAVTVDDAAQGVTDVVRGRDLLAATDIHRLLQALLGLPVLGTTIATMRSWRIATVAGWPRVGPARGRWPSCAAGGADPVALDGGAAGGRDTVWICPRRTT